MSKTEKVFWGILLFLAGAIIGAVAYAVFCPPRTIDHTDCRDNGMSIQADGNKVTTTYMPALDKCSS